MQTPELLSLILTLRPLPAGEAPAESTGWWGRAAHALLLRLVEEVDPELSARLHGESVPPPFTASTLMGRLKDGQADLAEPYTLRFTALERGLAEVLLNLLQPRSSLAIGARVDLDYRLFQVEAVCWGAGEHPWAGQDSYAALASGGLQKQQAPDRTLVLQLTSPTAFKTGGHHVALPLPELVFGSLLERWNLYAPFAFPSEARRYAAECLAVSRFELSTRPAPIKGAGLRVGAVGRVAFTALNPDRYWLEVMGALAAYARYAGVGIGTGMGMGQCRSLTGWKG